MVTNRNPIQRITRLTPLPDALSLVDRRVSAVAPRDVSLNSALGRVLAVVPVAPHRLPVTSIALRDGWAVRSEATLDAGSYAPALLADAPVAVEMGDPLPIDMDAVAPIDAVEFRGAVASAVMTVGPGEGVLPQGADITNDAVLFQSGRRLSRTDLAVLEAAGLRQVVVREPRVCVIAAHAGGDRVIDPIVTLICDLLAAEGATAIRGKPTSADANGFDDVLSDKDCDAVIVVGGSGVGVRDRSVHTLSRLGQLDFHGVGLVPGETAAFGAIGSRPVLIVPGRVDAALAVWLMFGRRMIARLSSRIDEAAGRSIVLKRKITSTIGLAELVVVQREGDGIVPVSSGYVSLQALARADGWVLVPPDIEGYPAGSVVEMRQLP
jgi:molybdopterin molybdotransferase